MTHYISDKFGEFTVFNQDGVINAVYKNDWGNSPEKKVFQFAFDEKLFNKLTGYKTVRGLRAFCEKHLTLVFHMSRDLDDRTRTVSALGDDVPNQSLPSDDCSDSPILPSVAVSSPAASDTLLKSATGEKSCDCAESPIGANKFAVESDNQTTNSERFLLPPNDANSDIYLQLSDHGHDWIKLEVYLAHSDPTIQITYSYAHQFSNDNAYKHINLPYSEYLLTCLLSCRNIKRLWAMAQSFNDDLQKDLLKAKIGFLESLS